MRITPNKGKKQSVSPNMSVYAVEIGISIPRIVTRTKKLPGPLNQMAIEETHCKTQRRISVWTCDSHVWRKVFHRSPNGLVYVAVLGSWAVDNRNESEEQGTRHLHTRTTSLRNWHLVVIQLQWNLSTPSTYLVSDLQRCFSYRITSSVYTSDVLYDWVITLPSKEPYIRDWKPTHAYNELLIFPADSYHAGIALLTYYFPAIIVLTPPSIRSKFLAILNHSTKD
jgi:hypothetical protein